MSRRQGKGIIVEFKELSKSCLGVEIFEDLHDKLEFHMSLHCGIETNFCTGDSTNLFMLKK